MNLTSNIVINFYSIIILIIIYFQSIKLSGKEYLQHKLFMIIIKLTIIMLIVDVFSRFDGKPNTIYPLINDVGNFLIFLLNPILPSIWLTYVHNQIFHIERIIKKIGFILLAINIFNIGMLILTQFYGWYYYIDSENIYHRGHLFWVSFSITLALVLATLLLIILNRDMINKKHYLSLLFFCFPPSISIILQIRFYGISFMLNSIVLSLLIVFLNIQNQDLYTDYLTGISNRKSLQACLKEKVFNCSEYKTFSGIMIDLNGFKSINDTFGHDMGDNALQITANLLSSCIRTKDFIARYGGDEFCIVLDTDNTKDLESIVSRIQSSFEDFNKYSGQPYNLGYSIGYAVYDYTYPMNVEEFQKHIDNLMYENKKSIKSLEHSLECNF